MNQETFFQSTEKEKNNNKKNLIKLGTTALLAFTLMTGTTGCSAFSEKTVDPLCNPEPTIDSITINRGANIRENHAVVNTSDGEVGNLIETTDETITVPVDGDAYISNDKANGDWYGVPAEDIQKADPKFDGGNHKNDIVWINSQKANVTYSDTNKAK